MLITAHHGALPLARPGKAPKHVAIPIMAIPNGHFARLFSTTSPPVLAKEINTAKEKQIPTYWPRSAAPCRRIRNKSSELAFVFVSVHSRRRLGGRDGAK
jgi:hypothetical protein